MTDKIKAPKDKVENIVDGTRQFAEDTIEKAKDVYGGVEDSVADGLKQGKKLIKKYPLEAALTGVAVGFLLGVLFTRRD